MCQVAVKCYNVEACIAAPPLSLPLFSYFLAPPPALPPLLAPPLPLPLRCV